MAHLKIWIEKGLSFLRLIRYWQWVDKIQAAGIAVVLLLIFNRGRSDAFGYAVLYLGYLHFAYASAYLINSRGDRPKDQQIRKNFFGEFSPGFVRVLSVFLGMGTALIPLCFGNLKIVLINFLI